MAAIVLVLTGCYALAFGLVRGYLCARAALVPLATAGEPTRALVESTKRVYARPRVRMAVRNVASALLWLAVAMYGLFLLSVGVAVLG